MPYTIVEQNGEFCVHKEDENGRPAERIACHASREQAEAQMAALYANEPEASKAVWTTAYINDLPDSCFLYIEDGGEKDEEGKTTPRSLRHFPYRNAQGEIDLPHLRNALARIPQSNLPQAVKDRLMAKARRILEEATERAVSLDDLYAVKALGQHRVGGYLVLWGDENQKDIAGEWFTPRTKGLTDIFKAVGKIPMYYHHGKDPGLGFDIVGVYDVMTPDDVGLWAEAQLDISNKYVAAIRELVGKGALGQSSQALASSRKVAPTGEILQWIIAEGTLTPTPCEPRMLIERPVAELKAAYKAVNLQFPDDLAQGGDEESRAKEREELELIGIEFDLLAISNETE